MASDVPDMDLKFEDLEPAEVRETIEPYWTTGSSIDASDASPWGGRRH